MYLPNGATKPYAANLILILEILSTGRIQEVKSSPARLNLSHGCRDALKNFLFIDHPTYSVPNFFSAANC